MWVTDSRLTHDKFNTATSSHFCWTILHIKQKRYEAAVLGSRINAWTKVVDVEPLEAFFGTGTPVLVGSILNRWEQVGLV